MIAIPLFLWHAKAILLSLEDWPFISKYARGIYAPFPPSKDQPLLMQWHYGLVGSSSVVFRFICLYPTRITRD